MIYALTYRVFRHLRGNIFGLSAQARPDRAFISVYLSLPQDLSPAAARDIVDRLF